MGNTFSNKSNTCNKKSYLFMYGYKDEDIVDDNYYAHRPLQNAINYGIQHEEIGCIKDLYWVNLWCAPKRCRMRTLLIKSFDAETGEEMYWQFDRSLNKWEKRNVQNVESIRFFSSLDAPVSFWINGQGEVFAEGDVWKDCIGRINSNNTKLSKSVKIPFFDSIQESVINIFAGSNRSFAICGSIIQFDQMVKISRFWINNRNKLIPNEIVKIIYDYVGNHRRIFAAGSYPNGHGFKPGISHNKLHIRDWTEIAAFKNIQIVSVACARYSSCTLFLDIHGNVYQCHINTAPYEIRYFSQNNIKVVKIICDGGWDQNLALDANGKVWSWRYPTTHHREPKPKLEKYMQISNHKIIDIQVRSNTGYAKTEDGKHFLFGNIQFGLSKLEQSRDNYKEGHPRGELSPIRIDDQFKRKTGCKIQNVCLGMDGHQLFIIGIK